MTIPLTPVSIDICRHFVFFIHVNFGYCEFRHFEKVIFCLGIWQALCVSIFRLCIPTHKGVNIDLIAGFYFWTPLKKKANNNNKKNNKKQKQTNPHYPREKTYLEFITWYI